MRPAMSLRAVAPLLAVLLVLLLAACGQAAAKPRATAPLPTTTPFPSSTPLPTVTVIQPSGDPTWGKTASWSHAPLPAGFGMEFHVSDLQVAASDGRTAYACAVPGDQTQAGRPRVLVTHDGGSSWAYASDIPAIWGACARLTVDMLDPSVVIAQEDFLGPQEITFDGGQSWQPLPLPAQQDVEQFATFDNRMYALLGVPENGGSSSITVLAESADHLRTWREIDGTLSSANLRQLWVNPGRGALMLQTYDTGLWTSTDDGAHWTQIGIPVAALTDYAVRQPVAGAPWRFCASYYASQDDSSTSYICTMDGGVSWVEPPSVVIQGQAIKFAQLAGIADDGSLMLLGSPDGTAQGSMVYCLAPGASRWQMLGKPPEGGAVVRYVSAPHGGILWMFPAESDGAGGASDPRAVFSAAYPYS